MRRADELRELVETHLRSLLFGPELGGLEAALRYSLEAGGKRIRPVLCLAVTEAAGGDVERALPAASALELVHTFSLVHDDLPSMDDDSERRGRPSAHVVFGDGVALLSGDALLVEALRLALSYDDPAIARELAGATLDMIGGQYRDITGDDGDLETLHRLKTGALFSASVGLGLLVTGVPDAEHEPWRAFGADLGLLFQIVDDLIDGDGYARRMGLEAAKELTADVARRAHARLDDLRADARVLHEIVDAVTFRTA